MFTNPNQTPLNTDIMHPKQLNSFKQPLRRKVTLPQKGRSNSTSEEADISPATPCRKPSLTIAPLFAPNFLHEICESTSNCGGQRKMLKNDSSAFKHLPGFSEQEMDEYSRAIAEQELEEVQGTGGEFWFDPDHRVFYRT